GSRILARLLALILELEQLHFRFRAHEVLADELQDDLLRRAELPFQRAQAVREYAETVAHDGIVDTADEFTDSRLAIQMPISGVAFLQRIQSLLRKVNLLPRVALAGEVFEELEVLHKNPRSRLLYIHVRTVHLAHGCHLEHIEAELIQKLLLAREKARKE